MKNCIQFDKEFYGHIHSEKEKILKKIKDEYSIVITPDTVYALWIHFF